MPALPDRGGLPADPRLGLDPRTSGMASCHLLGWEAYPLWDSPTGWRGLAPRHAIERLA